MSPVYSVTYVPGPYPALRSVGLLDVLHEYACGGLGRAPCQQKASLRLEAAPNSVESEGRFRLSTILSHLSFGVHRNLVSEFGFQHPEVLVALDAPEVLLRLQEG